MRRLSVLIAVLAAAAGATTVIAVPAAVATRSPSSAVRVAVAAAKARFHTSHVHAGPGLLSRRDPRWALVAGFATARDRLWAAWLHRDGVSRWTLRYFDTTAPFRPGSTAHGHVPCDLYPAFSEPACPSGPTPARIRAAVAAQLTPTGPAARLGALVAHGGYTLSFRPPLGGTLVVGWYPARGQGVTRRLLARGHADLLDGRRGRVRVTLTGAGCSAFAGAASLKVTATATFTPVEGAAVTASATFTLRR